MSNHSNGPSIGNILGKLTVSLLKLLVIICAWLIQLAGVILTKIGQVVHTLMDKKH